MNANSISSHLDQSKTATGIGAGQEAPLSREMAILEKVLGQHESTIDQLSERLEPVMMPGGAPVVSGACQNAPRSVESRVVELLRTARENLERMTNRLSDMIDRQQVR